MAKKASTSKPDQSDLPTLAAPGSKPKASTSSAAAKKAKAAEDLGQLGDSPSSSRSDPAGSVLGDLPNLALSEIIGHSKPLSTLETALHAERLAHALIFTGPQGVGKFTTALALARKLLSADPLSSPAPLTHPDLHIIKKELASISRDERTRASKQTGIAVEVIREFVVELAPTARNVQSDSPVGKVFVIDHADLMNHQAQNALLKTLEEPPLGTLIILVTSDEQALLPTVRSRSQRIVFSPLDEHAMRAWISTKKQYQDLDERQLIWLLSHASGSPGQFGNAVEFGLYAWHVALDPLIAAAERFDVAGANLLGPTMGKLVDQRTTEAAKAQPKASKETINRVWTGRMLSLVSDRLRKRMLGAARINDNRTATRCANMLDHIFTAEQRLDNNVQPSAVLDNLAAQLASA